MNIFNNGTFALFKGHCVYKDVAFDYEFFINPSKMNIEQSYLYKSDLIYRFGNQMVPEFIDKDAPLPRSSDRHKQHRPIQVDKKVICLDRTRKIVKNGLNNNLYDAIGFVKNTLTGDQSSCSLQYRDYYDVGTPQLWVCDLCRVSGDIKSPISPTLTLFYVIDMLAVSANIDYVYLMVYKKTNTHNSLVKRYTDIYNFVIAEDSPVFGINVYTFMKKSLHNFIPIVPCPLTQQAF